MGTDQLADHAPGVVIAEHHQQESDLGPDAQTEEGSKVNPDGVTVAHNPAAIDDHAQRVGLAKHIADHPSRPEAMAGIPE